MDTRSYDRSKCCVQMCAVSISFVCVIAMPRPNRFVTILSQLFMLGFDVFLCHKRMHITLCGFICNHFGRSRTWSKTPTTDDVTSVCVLSVYLSNCWLLLPFVLFNVLHCFTNVVFYRFSVHFIAFEWNALSFSISVAFKSQIEKKPPEQHTYTYRAHVKVNEVWSATRRDASKHTHTPYKRD